MAQQTRTWAEVVGLTQARAGAAFSSGTELTNIGFLLNSAARTIYDESRYWERFLVVEPRTVKRGYISLTENSINVYGCGIESVNGLYTLSADEFENHTVWELTTGDKPYYIRRETHNENNAWHIVQADSATQVIANEYLYSDGHDGNAPTESNWSVDIDGVAPTPITQALSEIGEAIGYWGSAKWEGNDPISLTAYPDSNGIRVASNVTGTVYVAYKKAWSDTYGNGESGTLATVPSEWAEFMAYDAARSYRASQDSESGFNPIALRDVNNALERALMKPSREGAIAALTNQLKTQYSTDNSV